MEYHIYNATKALKKHRIQILIGCLIVVAVIGLVYAVTGEDSTNKAGNLRGSEDTSSPSSSPSPSSPPQPTQTPTVNKFEIVKTRIRPGINQYYTQGLILKDQNTFIESAGLYKSSSIHYVDRETLEVGKEAKLGDEYFGEGCELINLNGEELIYQLTWQERKVFVWKAENLEQKQVLDLPKEIKEGWGITSRQEKGPDGVSKLYFYISDGSANIYVLEAETFKVVKTLPVKAYNGVLQSQLNELEFIKGKLWANIYYKNTIAIIDPETGYIEKFLDVSELQKEAAKKVEELKKLRWQRDYVLNGIAYDSQNDRVIITGKMWPIFWEIKVDDV